MSGPVILPVTPFAGEGLISFVNRTAAHGFLPSAITLLRQAGIPNLATATVSATPMLDERVLATVLRTSDEQIRIRRYRPADQPAYLTFFESRVRADEFECYYRRFSPTSLTSGAYDRAVWSLRLVPCCIESWEILLDRCNCGAKQAWHRAYGLLRCHACNSRLDRLPSRTVDKALRSDLAFLFGLLNPDEAIRQKARVQLPSSLAAWDGGLVFELALALLPLSSTGYPLKRGPHLKIVDPDKYLAALAETGPIIRGWPNAFHEALELKLKREALARVNPRYRGLDNYVAGLDSEVLHREVRQELEATLAPLCSQPKSFPVGQIGMREAALLTGHEEHSLAKARRVGALKTRVSIRASRIFPTLDKAEVEFVDGLLTNRVGLEEASSAFLLPQYALRLLADDHLIDFMEHPYIAFRYEGHQLHRSEMRRLADALEGSAVPISSLNCPVALNRAARAIGGGLKPWGTIFGKLLGGDIPFSMSARNTRGIFLSADDAASLRELDFIRADSFAPKKPCTQRDALEILNLGPKHGILLKSAFNVDNRGGIPWLELLRFANNHVSLAELAARTGIDKMKLMSRLKEVGLERSHPLGWPRGAAIQFIDQL